MQGLIEKRLLSMVLRMPIKKKLLGTTVQGANLWPAPAEITGQDDYKKILVEQIILCLNSIVREMQLMRSKKDSSNTKNVATENSMPDITARQKIIAKSDAKSDASKATIKRVQYLPVSEAWLRNLGRRHAFGKIIKSLLESVEKYLNTQEDVISFSNSRVLLPANPKADFVLIGGKERNIHSDNHPSSAVQPKLGIQNLKFDFMSIGDVIKILDVLGKRYRHIDLITVNHENVLKPYSISYRKLYGYSYYPG